MPDTASGIHWDEEMVHPSTKWRPERTIFQNCRCGCSPSPPVCEMAAGPVVVVYSLAVKPCSWTATSSSGSLVPGEPRARLRLQTIGTANSRNITKEKVLVVLKELPPVLQDPGDPTQPSAGKVLGALVTAQRLLP